MGYSEGERTLLKGNLMSSNPLARHRTRRPRLSGAEIPPGPKLLNNQIGGAG